MSYTDYLRRKLINTPKVIDTQMRLPDASSFTWRTKLANTAVDMRTHAINNTMDPSTGPGLNQHRVQSFPGSGFGGKVPDASTYTMGCSARPLRYDNFSLNRIQTNPVSAGGGCLTRPPASQVVSEAGNAEGSAAGLNMGYVTTCNDGFHPLTKSYFVDTIPELKTRKIGTTIRVIDGAASGVYTQSSARLVVQNTINCTTTDTSGVALNQLKADIPYNSYSPSPKNTIGSPQNLVNGSFITSPTGLQTGGGNTPGSRAPIVGGVSVKPKGTITHRGWGGRTRTPYPRAYVPPNESRPHLRLNGPIFVQA
jgi:hypothetical protein